MFQKTESLRPHLSLFTLAVLIALVAFAFSSENVQAFFYTFIYWVEGSMSAHPVLGAGLFVLLSGLSAMLAFASSLVLIPSALLTWGPVLTFFLLWSGWLAGAAIAYFIGARLARPLLSTFISQDKIIRYEKLVSKESPWWVIFLFSLAVPSEIPGYVLGVLSYPFLRFITAIAIVEALYAIGTILAAQNFLQKELLVTGGIILSVLILASLAFFLFVRLRTQVKRA